MADRIGVDHEAAPLLEQTRNRTLAAGNASREANDGRSRVLPEVFCAGS